MRFGCYAYFVPTNKSILKNISISLEESVAFRRKVWYVLWLPKKGAMLMAKNVQMAKATFANAQTGVGRVATQQATTLKQESGSSKMCWERRRQNARQN